MVDSCIGLALRDLQCIFKVTQQKVSLLHPVITTGRVVGSLLFLKISRCFNIYGVAATTMTTTCCIVASVPVMPIFWIALVLSGGAGLANGFTIHGKVKLQRVFGLEYLLKKQNKLKPHSSETYRGLKFNWKSVMTPGAQEK